MSATLRLLARSSLRRMRQRWLSSLLLVVGVGLASAVFIAVLYSSYASVRSFERSTNLLGQAEAIQLRSRSGDFAEAILEPFLVSVPDSVGIAASLESTATVIDREGRERSLTLLGLGLVAAPSDGSGDLPHISPVGTAMLSQAGFARYGLPVGDALTLRIGTQERTFPTRLYDGESLVAALSETSALSDLGSVQRIAGKRGRLSSVLFTVNDPAVREKLISDLRRFVEESERSGTLLAVQTEEARRSTTERLLSAFRSNIFIMVAMTFLVCVLTIFNAAHLSTLSAQQDYRVLRTLGVSRALIFSSVLMESLTIGVLGVAAGLSVGRPLTSAVSALFLGTVQELYLGNAVFPALGLMAGARLYLLAALAGLSACCVGALYPAWKASRLSGGFSRGGLAVPPRLNLKLLFLAGLIVASSAALCVWQSLSLGSVALSHLSALLILLALFLFSAPLLTLSTASPARALLRRARACGLVALSNTLSSLGSHSFTVGVGASAVSLLIALSVMVGSFRSTLHDWVNYTFRADVYVRPQEKGDLYAPTAIPESIVSALAALPDSQAISPYSFFSSEVRGVLLSIAGADLELGSQRGVYHVLAGELDLPSLQRGESVLLTETASRKLKCSLGDSISFEGHSARVVAIYQDFSSERGTILIDRAVFKRWFPQVGVATLGLYLRPSSDAAAVRQTLLSRLSTAHLSITLNSDLRTLVFTIFDETFKITALMRLIVILICGLGFVVTILQLMQERQRELKTLFTLGMSWPNIRLSIIIEALVLAVPSILLGSVGGVALALLLIDVINPISFGWSFRPVFAWGYFATAAAVVLISNLLAALVPAWVGAGVIRKAKLSEE